MYKSKKILAIIPARGGSKGLIRKNVKNLCGKPLFMWPYNVASESKYVDNIIISTEDSEVVNIASENGVEIPFLRPNELASDTSLSWEFIVYTLNTLAEKGEVYDYFVMLEPTSPLTETEDLDQAIENLINDVEAKSIVGVGETEGCHPNFLVEMENGFISPIIKSANQNSRRQDISKVYFFDGSLYISEVNFFHEKKSFYHDKTLGFEMPKYKNFEIDDIVDFYVIESIMQKKINGLL